ncbi:MAG: BatA domain-containing protein [Planctomycetales bacterium]|nr:BatA domain-containing protein [Planctomycetales bacterium]
MHDPPAVARQALFAVWGMSHAWMLLWSLAAAAPILIHLWNRRQRREVVWAAMRFLEAAVRKNARRLRIERWLLLTLRVLPLLLLGLALADPVAPWRGVGPAAGEPVHHVIVIDASYSMGVRAAGASASDALPLDGSADTPFERAKQAARQLIAAAPPGDAFSIVRMTDAPELLTTSPTRDAQEALAELTGLELSDGGAAVGATLALVFNLLERNRQPSQPWRQETVWLSDLCRVTWSEAEDPAFQNQLAAMSELATTRLVSVGVAVVPRNLAVTQLGIREPLPVIHSPFTVEVAVQSHHGGAAEGTLTLLMDGEEVATRALQPPEQGVQQLSIPLVVREPGEHWLEARVDADALTADDQRRHCFLVRDRLRALAVEGRAGDARELALALAPTTDGPLQVDVRSEAALVETELSDYDCVILSNVARLGANEARQLARYVSSGGGLLVFLGDQVQADGYNSRHVAAREDAATATGARSASGATGPASNETLTPLLPARIGDLKTEHQGVDPLDYRHAIVSVFRGHERAGLRSMPVNRYFMLEPVEDAEVVLRLENGDPLFLSRLWGDGRCVLCATAGSLQSSFQRLDAPTATDGNPSPPAELPSIGQEPWTAMPQWPSFLPLMQQLFIHLASSPGPALNVTVGAPLHGFARREPDLELLTPGGQRHQLGLDVDGRWFFAETTQRGLYRVRSRSRRPSSPDASNVDSTSSVDASVAYRAVNVDTRESDLTPLDSARLPKLLQPDTGQQVLTESRADASLFRWLLATMFVLLLAECWCSSPRASRQGAAR